MAEEADCFSYQADTLPTGSISFGRFATETLAWERRSSFSHNRYLEEAEKYSMPGSVTEKKAYFEAHFKKKGLQLQILRGRQNETENESNPEDFSGSDGSPGFVDNRPTEVLNSPSVSDAQEMSLYREEVSSSEYTTSEPTSDERSFHCDNDERYENQTGIGTISADEDTEQADLGTLLENENVTLTEPLYKIDISSNRPPAHEKNTLTSNSPIKVKETIENQAIKKNPETKEPVSQISRKSSTEKLSCCNSTERLGKLVKESACTKESQKQPFGTTPQSSAIKAMGLESLGMLKANLVRENSSGKVSNPKKGAAHTHLMDEKCETASKTSMSRSNPAVGSAKEEVKPTRRTFYFKSDERAEKRKEFNMKLEKKLYAKEAEMNEIQARTQEENEAKIKQLRKSLNFKATPMPSFYRESMPRVPDSKRPALGRSSKLQNRNHASRPLSNDKCQSSTIAVSRVLSSGEEKCFDDVEDHLITSGGKSGSPVVVNEGDRVDGHQQASVSVKKIGVVKKDDKVKHTIQQQQHLGTMEKGERFDKQRNIGKVLKGFVGGNFPVRVAS